MILTRKFRIKDASTGRHLDRHATSCNRVWNFCVATQREAERRYQAGKRVAWPTGYDLMKLCAGSTGLLDLHSDTVQIICMQFARSRDTHRKCPGFRASFGSRRALGWIPFIPRSTKFNRDTATYLKRKYRFWRSQDFGGDYRSGAFVQDARGRWYVTVQCEVEPQNCPGPGEVGIDLGLKALATCSDGTEIPINKVYRRYEDDLARAQRAGNKKRTRAIHAKIANARRHYLHVVSAKLTSENGFVAVGDVSASAIAKTGMGKSVHDAGWSAFRRMLRYKLARRQAAYVEVDERYTSQTCSVCGSLRGPRGLEGLGVRQWSCTECGTHHQRDVNSARLILMSGRSVALQQPEIPTYYGKTLKEKPQQAFNLAAGRRTR